MTMPDEFPQGDSAVTEFEMDWATELQGTITFPIRRLGTRL